MLEKNSTQFDGPSKKGASPKEFTSMEANEALFASTDCIFEKKIDREKVSRGTLALA